MTNPNHTLTDVVGISGHQMGKPVLSGNYRTSIVDSKLTTVASRKIVKTPNQIVPMG